jgi:acyl-coenzyme A synthetase/AMP-(fatty) acid ligase
VNISPAEIDDLLTGWPQVKEAAVVGMPDDVLGERMCQVVLPNGEVPSLAMFKLPERIGAVEALPRNAMNKVMRKELRDQVLPGLGQSDGARALFDLI